MRGMEKDSVKFVIRQNCFDNKVNVAENWRRNASKIRIAVFEYRGSMPQVSKRLIAHM